MNLSEVPPLIRKTVSIDIVVEVLPRQKLLQKDHTGKWYPPMHLQ
jgi:hypothetical protein